MFHKALTIALILINLAVLGTQAVLAAEFKLSSRYQDADGDMVADTPTESGEANRSKHVDLLLNPS